MATTPKFVPVTRAPAHDRGMVHIEIRGDELQRFRDTARRLAISQGELARQCIKFAIDHLCEKDR